MLTEGSFYGYKVFLVVDAASELPVAITMETGKRNDTAAFEPLIEDSMSGTTPMIFRQHWLMPASTVRAIVSSAKTVLTVRC